MSKYVINGGRKLHGQIKIQGAKNAVLPIFAASVLCEGRVVIHNSPKIADCKNMLNILRALGSKVSDCQDCVVIDNENIENREITSTLARELRSSIFLLGPILARFKTAKVAYPGGCEIGLRPIDMHLKGLRELNVDIHEEAGYIYCDASDMRGSEVQLDLPSVGATENLMMASISAKGKTVIRNAAKEPEIVDLQNFLNKCGAKIEGAGTSVITVTGGCTLKGVEYVPIDDRIVAGTYLLATCMCGGEIELLGVNSANLYSLVSKLSKYACKIITNNDRIYIKVIDRMSAVDIIETSPYPGFPTDLQAQTVAMLSLATGTSMMVENMFETRFKYIPELAKMEIG
ncbi:MAG: UDP-N-acetylglucosamine 1-carboxyvinyltransferase, partial [Clostridia bacterium]|nr:UDP-N-acetylglucosamine 1-carboxyvinyltransferase [Clostridia bacterium]